MKLSVSPKYFAETPVTLSIVKYEQTTKGHVTFEENFDLKE